MTQTPNGFIVQRFIPNDCDYRILYIGSEPLVIQRRHGQGTHLNNVSTGGSAELVPRDFLPETVYEHCRTIMQCMELELAGIDVIYNPDTGEIRFLEANSLPQLDSGAFKEAKAELLVKYLQNLFTPSA